MRNTVFFLAVVFVSGAMAIVPNTARGASVTLTDNGIAVSVSGMGVINLGYPRLQPGDFDPLEKRITGRQAELTYAGGVGVRVDVGQDGRVEFRFSNAGAIRSFRLGTVIGPQYGDEGGSWTIGDGEPHPFPTVQPGSPFLFQGNAGAFTLIDGSGNVLSVSGFPDYAYQQLQDNREWGWKVYQWFVSIPYNPDWDVHRIVIGDKPHSEVASAAIPESRIQVDRFGQTTRKDFPGRVRDEAELREDARTEADYWSSFTPPAVDSFGGLPGSGEALGLEATGFYRVEQRDGRWLLINPEGNLTFHLGICVFGYNPGDEATYVHERRDSYAWLPSQDGEFASAWHPEPYWRPNVFSFYAANVLRKYGFDTTKDEQIGRLVDRVRAVGFNHIGAFSGSSPVFIEKRMPRMAMVGFNPELPGIRGVADPFCEDARRRTDESWSRSLPRTANDPLIVGYYFANEQGFEDIPRAVPRLSGEHAAKRKLVEMLREKYPTVAAFNDAWGVQVDDFASLNDMGLPVTTQAAFADMQAYTEVFLDTYFRFITETFRKYNPNHLMVANRWMPSTANNETLCRIAGQYMDVISINYYALGVDRNFIERLYRWTGGKPQIWSEFYYTSEAESNAAGTNMDMATQALRGQAYRQYVEQAAATGFVVGVEWFTLIDQAVSGRWFSRFEGERANTGLFNAADRPYDDCLREMAKTHAVIHDVWLGKKEPFVLDDPRFTGGAGKTRRTVQAGRVERGAITVDGMAVGWPGRPPELIGSDRVVAGRDGEGLEASFRLAWDNENLYVLVNVTDPTPMSNERHGDRLWDGDGVELFIGSEKLDQPGTLLFSDRQVLLGAHREASPRSTHVVNAAVQPAIPLALVPTVDGSGYTLEAAIPWSALDITPAEDLELIFDLAIDDGQQGRGRTRQLMWNGGSKNSGDRSYWGRLRLVP